MNYDSEKLVIAHFVLGQIDAYHLVEEAVEDISLAELPEQIKKIEDLLTLLIIGTLSEPNFLTLDEEPIVTVCEKLYLQLRAIELRLATKAKDWGLAEIVELPNTPLRQAVPQALRAAIFTRNPELVIQIIVSRAQGLSTTQAERLQELLCSSLSSTEMDDPVILEEIAKLTSTLDFDLNARFRPEHSTAALAADLRSTLDQQPHRWKRANSPVELAALSGELATLKVLTRAGARLTLKDAEGNETCLNHQKETPLLFAVHAQAADVVTWMLGMGVDPDLARSDGWTALCIAAGQGYSKVISALLQGGASAKVTTATGKTALCLAAENSQPECIAIIANTERARLVKLGYSPKEASKHLRDLLDKQDNHNKTPLWYAAELGDLEEVQELLLQGANPDATSRHAPWPLEAAIVNNDLAVVRVLVAAGANPFMHHALCSVAQAGHQGMVEYLLGRGVSAQAALLSLKSEEQPTAEIQALLRQAATAQNTLKTTLLEAGADPGDLANLNLMYHLYYAAKDGNRLLLQRLIKLGGEASKRNISIVRSIASPEISACIGEAFIKSLRTSAAAVVAHYLCCSFGMFAGSGGLAQSKPSLEQSTNSPLA